MIEQKPKEYFRLFDFLLDIHLGRILIPELQHPFLRTDEDVLDFIKELYLKRNIGYFVLQQEKKEGRSYSDIMIDGQQKAIAMLAVFFGREVLTPKYSTKKITISFNIKTEQFCMQTTETISDPEWISDIFVAFKPNICETCFVIDNYGDNLNEEEKYNIYRLFFAAQEKVNIIRTPTNYKNVEAILEKDSHSRYLNKRLEHIFRLSEQKNKEETDYKEENYYYERGKSQYGLDYMRAWLDSPQDPINYSLNKRVNQFCFLTQSLGELKKLEESDSHLQQKNHKNIMPNGLETYPKDKIKLLSNNIYHPNYFDILNIALNLALGKDNLYFYHNLIRKISDPSYKENKEFYGGTKKKIIEAMNYVINENYFNEFIKIIDGTWELRSRRNANKGFFNKLYTRYLWSKLDGIEDKESIKEILIKKV